MKVLFSQQNFIPQYSISNVVPKVQFAELKDSVSFGNSTPASDETSSTKSPYHIPFLYDPTLSDKEKSEKLESGENFVTVTQLANTMNQKPYFLKDAILEGQLDAEKVNLTLSTYKNRNTYKRNTYLDVTTEKNKQFIEANSKEPYTIPILHDKSISPQERVEAAKNTQGVLEFSDLAQELGISPSSLYNWESAGVLLSDTVTIDRTNRTFVDTNEPKNKEFLDGVKEKLDGAVYLGPIMKKYNLNETEVKAKYLEMLPQIGGTKFKKGNNPANLLKVLIDLKDERYQQFIEKLSRTRAFPHKQMQINVKSGKTVANLVSVKELERLGFGDVKTLVQMLAKKELPGEYETKIRETDGKKVATKAKVDISQYSTEKALTNLRAQNENVVTLKDFTQRFELKQAEAMRHLEDGKLKIIPEFLFEDDAKTVFIDLESNKDFIEELKLEAEIQKQLAEELRAQRAAERSAGTFFPEQSLKMKIAWALMPNVREVMSNKASRDGFVGAILQKQDEEKELTTPEKIHLGQYRQKVWATPGAKAQMSSAVNMAGKIIKQMHAQGVGSIDDAEIAGIIKAHYDESSDDSVENSSEE